MTWGADHLGPGADAAKPTGKVQDAHEAIRPSRIAVAAPAGLDEHQVQLYALIRARTLASQMSPARFERIALTCRVAALDAPLTGGVSWRVHAGWQAAFAALDKVPAEAPPATNLAVGERLDLAVGDVDVDAPGPLRAGVQIVDADAERAV